MKAAIKGLVTGTAAMPFFLLLGCGHVTTGRQVVVDLARDEIAIVKNQRVLTPLSIDGPLPKKNEHVFVISRVKLAGSSRVVLVIPDNAEARYGALAGGRILLDFDQGVAVVQVSPSSRYSRLNLNGEYPLVLDRLWKNAPDRLPNPASGTIPFQAAAPVETLPAVP